MALTTGMGSFDSQASRKRDVCFAQDDRCWVHLTIQGVPVLASGNCLGAASAALLNQRAAVCRCLIWRDHYCCCYAISGFELQ